MLVSKKTTSALKGIAVIGVVIIHMTSKVNSASVFGQVTPLLNQYARFAVPFFFLMSGFGLEKSHKFSLPFRDFLKGRLGKLVPAYVIWNLVYYIIIHRYGMDYNFLSLVKGVILGTISPQMYYVPLLLMFYVMYPILRRSASDLNYVIFWLVVTFLSQSMSILYPISNLQGLNVLNWIGYFVIGIFLGRDSVQIHISKVMNIFIDSVVVVSIIMVGVLAYRGYGVTNFNPFVVPYSLALFWLFTKLKALTHMNLFIFLGRKSYTIYLAHLLFLRILGGLIPVKGFFSFFLVLFGVLALSVVTDLVIIRMTVLLKKALEKLHLKKMPEN